MRIGFAIPIGMAEAIKEQLVTRGKVVRGYLGVRIQELTKELAQSFGLDTTQGVLVAEVSQGSPAAEAGLQSESGAITRVRSAGVQICGLINWLI